MNDRELYNKALEKNRLMEIEINKIIIQRDLLIAISEKLIKEHWYNKDTTSEFVQCNSSRTAPPTWRKLDYALKLINEAENV